MLLRANSNKSKLQNVELACVAHQSAGQQVHLPSPLKDPQGEKLRYQANADLPRRANSNRSESQNFDLLSGTHTSAASGHQVRLPSPSEGPCRRKGQTYISTSKDPSASGQSLTAPAPRVTKTSRWMQDTAPGEPHAPRVRTPPEVPVYPNGCGESAHPDKGGNDVLNKQQAPNGTLGESKTRCSRLTQDTAMDEPQAPPQRTLLDLPANPNASRECAHDKKRGPSIRLRAPNDVFFPLVRHPPATDPPPRCQSSPQPITTCAYYVLYLQAADHSVTPPLPTAEHRSQTIRSNAVPMHPTLPMAVSQQRNEATGPPWSERQEQPKEEGPVVHMLCCASNGATKTLCCSCC